MNQLDSLLQVLGGIGLFLLGKTVMTQGLESLARRTMRRALTRFTKSPRTGAITGAAVTALVQSSSATTVAAVGFVAAGLLTFSQSLGIIFGANVGTTVTGWIVMIVGFKLHLGATAMPLILAGTLLHLFARNRTRHLGWAIAGFGLIFVGIDSLAAGMEPFSDVLATDRFPADDWIGRLTLVGIGVAVTIVTQSSSAGVVLVLAALGSGTIVFSQAAALVIGMDVGTTFSAVLATVGGNAASRRTGFAHVVFNLFTAAGALLLLDPFTWTLERWLPGGPAADPQLSVLLFHTTLNVFGTLAILPFARPFASLMIRLVPERGPELTRRLEPRLLSDPDAAALTALVTVREITRHLLRRLRTKLRRRRGGDAELDAAIQRAIDETHRYVWKIRPPSTDESSHERVVALLHVLDHLARLATRLGETEGIPGSLEDPRLARLARWLHRVAGNGSLALIHENPTEAIVNLDRTRQLLREQRRTVRHRTLDAASRHTIGADDAMDRLDAVRWLHRVSYHLWRIFLHLDAAHVGTTDAKHAPTRRRDAPRVHSSPPKLLDDEAEPG